MQSRLKAQELVFEAWAGVVSSSAANLRWIGLLIASAGFYSIALHEDGHLIIPFGFACLVFGAGVLLSLQLYRTLLGNRSGRFLPLVHANLAVYVVFLFAGFFVGFFLLVLPGILIRASGLLNLERDTEPQLVQQAFLDLMSTPYGTVYIVVCCLGAAALSYLALRLSLYGVATVSDGKAQVFRSWALTKGQLRPLALASLATHVMPFEVAIALNYAIQPSLPESAFGHFIRGAVGMALVMPFLIAGHGYACAAWRRLKSETA